MASPDIPTGASQHHDRGGMQILEAKEYLGSPTFQRVLQKEGYLIHRASELLRQGEDPLTRFRRGRVLTIDEIKDASAIEAAALILRYPQWLVSAPNTPAFYRFARTHEMATMTERGGDRLFVGSTRSTHELLAYYTQPPTQDMIGVVAGYDIQAMGLNLRENTDPMPLARGHAIAIEPDAADPRFSAKIQELNRFFGFPDSLAAIHGITLGEAFSTSVVPHNLAAIVVNRADPRIFYSEEAGKLDLPSVGYDPRKVSPTQDEKELAAQRDKNMKAVLETFREHLAPEGRLIITIGGSKDTEGIKGNARLLANLFFMLGDSGYDVESSIPRLLTTEIDDFYFGGEEHGILGAVTAFKK